MNFKASRVGGMNAMNVKFFSFRKVLLIRNDNEVILKATTIGIVHSGLQGIAPKGLPLQYLQFDKLLHHIIKNASR